MQAPFATPESDMFRCHGVSCFAKDKDGTVLIALVAAACVLKSRRVTVEAVINRGFRDGGKS